MSLNQKIMKSNSSIIFLVLCIFLYLSSISISVFSQKKKDKSTTTLTYDEKLYSGLKWRNIGPFRGGRSAAVTGVKGKPTLFYMGSTGGGVWRTTNGGSTWENISDAYFGGSIGAVAVSESDNNVIYVGGGEVTVRGNVSAGNGVWKSLDAGDSWTHVGLSHSKHIPRIRIHPTDPEIVYAAVLGDLYQSSNEKGVFRSKDGGKSWQKILFVNADAGAVDLTFDPTNPRIMYASTWNVRRTPYSLSSGGEGSGLYKSKDGGDTWEKLSVNKGFPKGTLGIIGVSVSPVNPHRVWALVEADKGGLFRSDNGGVTWTLINADRSLRQRAWYYTRIYADTEDQDKVHVLNVRYHQSEDGGKTFKSYNTPHGDHHDLWIAPEDANRIIIGDDGGAQVSYDGGKQWSSYMNQPTAQFYRVSTDNHFPYRIYGGQQDNSAIRIAHRSSGPFISERDWESTAGGESAQLAIENNNEVVYGSSYLGFLMRYDHRSEESRDINVWPYSPVGHGVESMKYRFQWNFPVFISPHDDQKLYVASNHLHVSTNGGESWKTISPDLTRNDSIKLLSSGGPITQDNTGVEYYCTIFSAVESPYEEDLLWTGSDDGLIFLSKDGGDNWENVSPKGMPEWMMINSIDIDPFTKGGAYIAGTRYKSGDDTPYLYRTKDYGKTWTVITNGIPSNHFTRVLRADPKRPGLLYAGTENGMYISFDDGISWKPFQLNLPIVPITDLTIKEDNLIAATQGRGFWLIDDLTLLHQLNDDIAASEFHLFKPKDSYIMETSYGGKSLTEGENHPNGVLIYTYFRSLPDSSAEVSLEIKDASGMTIKSFSPNAEEKEDKWNPKDSTQLFVWNMLYPNPITIKGMYFFWIMEKGPSAIPGEYQAVLHVGDDSLQTTFTLLIDPRVSASQEDLQDQFEFLIETRDLLSAMHQAIIDMRLVRKQLEDLKAKTNEEENPTIIEEAIRIDSLMTHIENAFYQTKNQSEQDMLNYPIMLNNKLGHLSALANMGYNKPTDQMYELKEELEIEINTHLEKWNSIQNTDIKILNQMVRSANVDAIYIPDSDSK
jgi:photosystem II stability/assembly factor-like uncharacterized protein